VTGASASNTGLRSNSNSRSYQSRVSILVRHQFARTLAHGDALRRHDRGERVGRAADRLRGEVGQFLAAMATSNHTDLWIGQPGQIAPCDRRGGRDRIAQWDRSAHRAGRPFGGISSKSWSANDGMLVREGLRDGGGIRSAHLSGINHRLIKTNGIRMHIAEQGTGPLVLLCHGFPESWYSWRHQIKALAEAGFHAVAPDARLWANRTTRSDRPICHATSRR